MSRIHRRLGVLCVAVAVAGVAACTSGTTSQSTSASSQPAASAAGVVSGPAYTPAEVAAATGSYKVQPLFAVPKQLPRKYRIVFLNNGKSNAFFATWSQAMSDAAKFYGVDFQDIDLNFQYENELSDLQQLAAAQKPDVVGANVMNVAVDNQIKQYGAKLVMIDGSFANVPNYGVPDAQVGQLAIQTLAPDAKTKMAGAWKGRKVDVVGMSAPNCSPCDARVKAGFAEAESSLGIPAADTFMLTPQGQDPTSASQSSFTDFLTAHPHDAVLVMSYGDEPVIGAVNATKAVHRGSDILAVTNGGDAAARTALRDPSNAGILIASIDYQPYAEGWNFIEAAVATELGQPFQPYKVDRVLTAANVNTYYPNDKK